MNKIKISAYLGLATSLLLLSGCKTGTVQIMTEHHAMPSPRFGNGPCGSYYECLVFNNAPNPGYATPQGKTNCLVRVTDVDAGIDVPTADYHLFWQSSANTTNCAANYSATQKQVPCSYPTAFAFTIYFKNSGSPPAGHQIYLYTSYLP